MPNAAECELRQIQYSGQINHCVQSDTVRVQDIKQNSPEHSCWFMRLQGAQHVVRVCALAGIEYDCWVYSLEIAGTVTPDDSACIEVSVQLKDFLPI